MMLIALGIGAAVGWLAWEFATAPDGYEDDERGFVYGRED